MPGLSIAIMVALSLVGGIISSDYSYPQNNIVFFSLSPGDLGEPRSSYMLGSAKSAEGKNIIISLYADTPDNSWSDDERDAELEKLREACEYIEDSASSYGRDAEFITDYKSDRRLLMNSRIYRPVENSDDFYDYLDRITALWIDYVADYDGLLEKYDADGIFMIIHFKEAGRSYAVCYDGIDNEDESLIVYNDATASTYAHEILHLFGAHDFYSRAEYTEDAVSYIEEKYPDDIMLTLGQSNKITSKIGELTAYHLGWLDAPLEVKEFSQLQR